MKPPLQNEEVHLRDYLYILRKRRLLIIGFALLVFAAGLVFTYQEKVLYKATSTILIEREHPNIVDFKEVMSFDASTSDYYQTQHQMLQSRTLIEKLIREEGLETDPYLVGASKGRLRSLVRTYRKWLPSWIEDFMEKPNLASVFIRNMLRVNPVRNSRLVQVSVFHPNPQRSAELTNRLIELYIQRSLEDRYAVSKRATKLLSTQLVELKEKVAIADKNLQEYKEEYGLVNIPSVREKDKFIQDAKLELVKLQAEEAMLTKRYLPDHPKMISIRSQVEGLDSKIKEEEEKTLGLSRIAIEYAELEREAESARRIYQTLLERLEETESAAQTQASNIMIVDRAIPPAKPFKPRPLLNIMVALLVGLIGGVLLAFFIEYLDPTVRIPDDIEKALGLEVFGIIPKINKNWRKGPAKGELFMADKKNFVAAESFRALRTAMLFQLRGSTGCRVLLVTSANPSEGKSTVSLNMAAAFAQNNFRVLLIDGDLRKPRLHKLFNISQNEGLSDVLEEKSAIEDCIHENIDELGFDFLSCGTASQVPTEILGSENMKETMEQIKEGYDIVVVDSPPFLAVADVFVLNEFADATLVVARYQKTHRRHLKDLHRNFVQRGTEVVGVVINQVSVRERDYYYNQYYYYGYGETRGA